MVFEQTYTVKIKTTGNSTMRMELFEEILLSVCRVCNEKGPTTKVELLDKNGKPVTNQEYSFDRYANRVNIGRNKPE